jgi:hypothetical protein
MKYLKSLYEKWAGSLKIDKKVFTTLKFMSIIEWKAFLEYYKIFDENFVERDINFTYNFSMMTQIDELTNERTI